MAHGVDDAKLFGHRFEGKWVRRLREANPGVCWHPMNQSAWGWAAANVDPTEVPKAGSRSSEGGYVGGTGRLQLEGGDKCIRTCIGGIR